jgi:hypothetical protein
VREIFPITGVAVFQVDEKVDRAGRPTPDHVGKALGARMVWAMMVKGERYKEPVALAA